VSILIKILFTAAFFNSLSWIILIPIWQYPDEQAHFAQVQDLAEIGFVPVGGFNTSLEIAFSEKVMGTERDGMGNNKYTYHPQYKTEYTNSIYGPQEKEISSLPKSARKEFTKNEATLNPPLYYFMSSIVYKVFSWGDIFTRVYALRIFSAVIFLLTIVITYKIGQIVFNKDKIQEIAFAAIVAFSPMLVFATSGVLPDTLNIFLFTFFFYICLKIISLGFSIKRILILILIISLGAMTRQNFLITLFILPIPIIFEFIENYKTRRTILITTLFASFGIYTLSYFVPSMHFIHQFDYPESSGKNPNNPLVSMTFKDHLAWTIKQSIAQVWPWFWGIYKWLSLALPPEVYRIINRLIPFAIIGLLIKIYYIIKKRDVKNGKILLFLIFSVLIYCLMLTTFDYLFRKNNGYSFGIQGRYYFPVIVPTFALMLTGFWQLFSLFQKYSKYLLFALVFLFFTFNVFSLSYLAGSYYNTSTPQAFINHASQYKPIIFKGNIIYLIVFIAVILQAIFIYSFGKFLKSNNVNIINK